MDSVQKSVEIFIECCRLNIKEKEKKKMCRKACKVQLRTMS